MLNYQKRKTTTELLREFQPVLAEIEASMPRGASLISPKDQDELERIISARARLREQHPNAKLGSPEARDMNLLGWRQDELVAGILNQIKSCAGSYANHNHAFIPRLSEVHGFLNKTHPSHYGPKEVRELIECVRRKSKVEKSKSFLSRVFHRA